MIPLNEALEQCIQSLIDERIGVSNNIARLKGYEETLINDARHFKRILKRRVHDIDAETRKSVIDNMVVRLIISTRNQKRTELWNNLNQKTSGQ